MTKDKAFEYLKEHEIKFEPEGVNFKRTYRYHRSERIRLYLHSYLLMVNMAWMFL
ncbi:hypothetical protein [Rodentibacter caecimuris]|uniref:hypothetical protein n=1 Tax=Rodentibacter caecimuris TaxID=1796644 RepID=UPI0012FFAF66|nr:hypothetical protein [Rodentibacter heylii]